MFPKKFKVIDTKEVLKRAYELGFNYECKYGGCTQSAISAIFEALKLEINDDVFKAGTGLAGGLGISGEGSCGALIGGAMVISYLFPRTYSNFDDPEKKRWRTYKLVKELLNRFKSEYGSVRCSEVQKKLFGRSYNLWDEKEYEKFIENGGHTDKCPSVVGKVAQLTVDIILHADEILSR